MKVAVSPARPPANPQPYVDVVYVEERYPRYPAPIEVLAAPAPRTVVVLGVRIGTAVERPTW